MTNLSIVSHIKNDIEFLEQFWKHIHSYNPREIVVIDTGSLDGTWEKLQELPRNEETIYNIQQIPHYTGQVFIFNKVIELATSKWVMKIDTDELYRNETKDIILKTIEEDYYNCINLPTVHHFINSDLYFNVIKDVPDYHQRIFKKEVYGENSEAWSKNHGSLVWAKELKMLTLGMEHAMYHYSLLRPLWKLQKRSIINYYIDIVDMQYEKLYELIEELPEFFIRLFKKDNFKCVPTWELKHTQIPFNDHEQHYIDEFIKWGRRVDFPKPEDLIVNKICDWPKAEETLKIYNLL